MKKFFTLYLFILIGGYIGWKIAYYAVIIFSNPASLLATLVCLGAAAVISGAIVLAGKLAEREQYTNRR